MKNKERIIWNTLILGILGTADMGYNLLRIIGVGDQIVLRIYIPILGELIYLVGVFVIISSLAAIFAPRNISKAINWCQGFILTAIFVFVLINNYFGIA